MFGMKTVRKKGMTYQYRCRMSDILVELLGIIAGTLGVIAWVPQLNEVWKQKKHEGISLPTLYLICTALLLWLVYGFIIGSIAIIISNLAALYCILIIIFGVNKLRETDAYLFFTKIWVSFIQK